MNWLDKRFLYEPVRLAAATEKIVLAVGSKGLALAVIHKQKTSSSHSSSPNESPIAL